MRYVAAGVAFGRLIRAGDHAGGAIGWLVNIAGPWLILAFAIGARAPDPRTAVERSTVALIAAVPAKYALQLAQGDITLAHAAVRTLAWSAAAVAVSLVFAPAGQRRAYWRLAAALVVAAVTRRRRARSRARAARCSTLPA